MHFVICDDEADVRKQLVQYSERLAFELNQDLQITEFSDGLDLIETFPSDANIVFLDISMRHLDGIQAAKKIRQFDKNICIIFITSMVQYALECYKVHAYSFLPKPLRYAEFCTEVTDAIHQFTKHPETAILVDDGNGRRYRVYLSNLLYLEVMDHKVTLHMFNETLTVRKNLREFEKELSPQGFIRCHNSYLVNAEKVAAFLGNELEMRNGDIIPISKQRRKHFIEEFTQYAGGLL